METKQPKWKVIAQIGNKHPIVYGGCWILVDETGVYPPECEKWEPDEDGKTGRIWRWILEPCTLTDGVLSDNKFHPHHPAWFSERLPEVSNFIGMEHAELVGLFCSSDPIDRAIAWNAVADYFGVIELDSYPVTLDFDEAQQRYTEGVYAS